RNSLGGFHHGSGAIAPIKKPDIWLQYLSAIFKKKHLVYWERPYMGRVMNAANTHAAWCMTGNNVSISTY
ncbi:hypothetical protein, partial [Yersinia enterocolitica]|uniref:hypothetical protein n=2 Tax=Yersinia enterocolitica TaxID=630 RepID=UPI001C10487B